MMTANEVFLNDCGHRGVIDFFVKREFYLRIATRYRIADDDHIRALSEVFGPVAFAYGNAKPLKLKRHRRINVFVRASDRVTLLGEHPCERSHRRPANSDQMIAFLFQQSSPLD